MIPLSLSSASPTFQSMENLQETAPMPVIFFDPPKPSNIKDFWNQVAAGEDVAIVHLAKNTETHTYANFQGVIDLGESKTLEKTSAQRMVSYADVYSYAENCTKSSVSDHILDMRTFLLKRVENGHVVETRISLYLYKGWNVSDEFDVSILSELVLNCRSKKTLLVYNNVAGHLFAQLFDENRNTANRELTTSLQSTLTAFSEEFRLQRSETVRIQIPDEIWLRIFSLLPKIDLYIAKCVCKKWLEIGKDETLVEERVKIWRATIDALQNPAWVQVKRTVEEVCSSKKILLEPKESFKIEGNVNVAPDNGHCSWIDRRDPLKLKIFDENENKTHSVDLQGNCVVLGFIDPAKICLYLQNSESLATYEIIHQAWQTLDISVSKKTCSFVDVSGSLVLTAYDTNKEEELKYVFWDANANKTLGEFQFAKFQQIIWNEHFVILQVPHKMKLVKSVSRDSYKFVFFELKEFKKIGELGSLFRNDKQISLGISDASNMSLCGSILGIYIVPSQFELTSGGITYSNMNSLQMKTYTNFYVLGTEVKGVARLEHDVPIGGFCIVNDLYVTFRHTRGLGEDYRLGSEILFYKMRKLAKTNIFNKRKEPPFTYIDGVRIKRLVTEIKMLTSQHILFKYVPTSYNNENPQSTFWIYKIADPAQQTQTGKRKVESKHVVTKKSKREQP